MPMDGDATPAAGKRRHRSPGTNHAEALTWTRRSVRTSENYRQKAAEYLRVARETDHLGNRTLLLEMALSWIKLAEQAGDNTPAAPETGLGGVRGIDANCGGLQSIPARS